MFKIFVQRKDGRKEYHTETRELETARLICMQLEMYGLRTYIERG